MELWSPSKSSDGLAAASPEALRSLVGDGACDVGMESPQKRAKLEHLVSEDRGEETWVGEIGGGAWSEVLEAAIASTNCFARQHVLAAGAPIMALQAVPFQVLASHPALVHATQLCVCPHEHNVISTRPRDSANAFHIHVLRI